MAWKDDEPIDWKKAKLSRTRSEAGKKGGETRRKQFEHAREVKAEEERRAELKRLVIKEIRAVIEGKKNLSEIPERYRKVVERRVEEHWAASRRRFHLAWEDDYEISDDGKLPTEGEVYTEEDDVELTPEELKRQVEERVEKELKEIEQRQKDAKDKI